VVVMANDCTGEDKQRRNPCVALGYGKRGA
jgi:hypothetical protein